MFIKISHYLPLAVYVVFLILEPGSGICAKLHVVELGSKTGVLRQTDDSTQREYCMINRGQGILAVV
jgi:hypothetical protein